MSSSKIGSRKAVEIIREIRPRASRASLQSLVQRGLLTAEPIHCRRFAYNEAEVRTVASRLAEEDQL